MSAPDVRLRSFLNPSSVALVGATNRGLWAGGLVDNLRRWGYPGRLWMVNPNRDSVFDQPCYPSVTAIPEAVDHVLVVVAARHVLSVLRDARDAGVFSATVISAGFAESSSEGRRLSDEVRTFCWENKILMLGPNCYGFANLRARALLTRNTVEAVGADGRIALLSQSGNLQQLAYGLATSKGLDLGYTISTGNELVLDSNDFIEYFIDDEQTTVVAAILEQIPNPRRFEAIALKALRARKPLVVCKLGNTPLAQRVAVAHTGSIAGVSEVARSFLCDLGVMLVSSVEELVETASVLVRRPYPFGSKTFLMSGSGGSGGLFADLAESSAVELCRPSAGLRQTIAQVATLPVEVSSNPLDLSSDAARGTALAEAPQLMMTVAKSGEYDTIVVGGEEPLSVELQGEFWPELMRSYITAGDAVADATGTNVVLWAATDRGPTTLGLSVARSGRTPFLHGPVGVRALSNAITYDARRSDVLARTERDQSLRDRAPQPAMPTRIGTLSEWESAVILAAHGIPSARAVLCGSADQAVSAASDIGYPVVLKIVSADIPHKSDFGGVALGLRSESAVRSAYSHVTDNAGTRFPDSAIDGVLVAKQIESSLEMVLGVSADPQIGPAVMIGFGGIHVETLHDVSIAMAPFGPDTALELLQRLRGWPILAGARQQLRWDVEALARTMSAFSIFAYAWRERLVAADVNPLFVGREGSGVVAADSLIVLQGAE
jgi:acyl-CoA synthetase (NDP forming)